MRGTVGQRGSARPTRDRARQESAEFLRARQACAVSGNANPIDLVSSGSREGDASAKPKEYFSWGNLATARVSAGTSQL